MTISPARNSTFTTSAGDFPSFSASTCGVAPCTTCNTGPDGFGGSGFGSRSRRAWVFVGATAAAGAGTGASAGGVGAGASRTTVFAAGLGLARGLRGCGGGSSTSRGLAVAAVAFPPEARRRGTRSSGTLEEADFPSAPICASASSSSLLVTPSSFASSWTLTCAPASTSTISLSLRASSGPTSDPSARPNAPCRSAASTHAGLGCTYAPRPLAVPLGSTRAVPSAVRTTRTSAAFAARPRQPTQVRRGARPSTAFSPPRGPPGRRWPASRI